MVGYPSLSTRMRGDALNNIEFDVDVTSIWTYDSDLQVWEEVGPSDYLQMGRGYIIHSNVEKTWDVPL